MRDLWRGRLSWRRLGVILEHLPPESAFKTAVRDALTPAQRRQLQDTPSKGHGPWSTTDLLLAMAIDQLRFLAWQQYQLKNVKTDPPQPMPRPGVEPAQPGLSPEWSEFMERRRAQFAAQRQSA